MVTTLTVLQTVLIILFFCFFLFDVGTFARQGVKEFRGKKLLSELR
jgi:hypothetical protein